MRVRSGILGLQNDHTSFYLLVEFLLICGFLNSCNGTPELNPAVLSYDDYRIRPEVRIPHGSLRGVNMVTRHGRNIFGFKGIPFAKPPVGNLRFRGPLPADPWFKILDAGQDSIPCPQLTDDDKIIGDEDCLYLNVYTPKLPSSRNSTLLPVMVYAFGGGFKKGNNQPADWGPNFILDKDVILVVPNYRTGLLGYLSTGDEVSPGNYGLKDLVRALEWNRENIRYFGGDSNRVTFVGGSSGGMSVELLSLSRATNGLFHRYISQSGPALSPHAQHNKKAAISRTIRVGKYLNCPTCNSKVLVDCLRHLNASELVKTEPMFYVWDKLPSHIWAPVVEPDIEGALLTDTVANLFSSGTVRDLPRLYSLTSDEGIVFRKMLQKPKVFEDLLNNLDVVLPAVLLYDDWVNNVTAYTAALRSYYLNDLTADRRLLLNNYTQLTGDALFTHPVHRELEQFRIHSKSPQYLCSFEYRGALSQSYTPENGFVVQNVSVHGDECIYLFKSPPGLNGPRGCKMTDNDWKIVDMMVQLWTSFVITGTPTLSDPKNTIIWEPYSSRKNYLRIGNKSDVSLKIGYNLFKNRSKFWEQLIKNNIQNSVAE